jgi:hypothetical protein
MVQNLSQSTFTQPEATPRCIQATIAQFTAAFAQPEVTCIQPEVTSVQPKVTFAQPEVTDRLLNAKDTETKVTFSLELYYSVH